MEKLYEVFIDAFAGASGGVISQMLFYPLENFRTRMQAQVRDQEQQEGQ